MQPAEPAQRPDRLAATLEASHDLVMDHLDSFAGSLGVQSRLGYSLFLIRIFMSTFLNEDHEMQR